MMVRFQYISYFLVLWNTIGAIILTFHGPFWATSNGVSVMQCVSPNIGKNSSLNSIGKGFENVIYSFVLYHISMSIVLMRFQSLLVSNMTRYAIIQHEIQYFAIWAMAIISVMASNIKTGGMANKLKSSSALGGLLMASMVLILAITILGYYDWRMIFSLIVACITNVVCSIFIYLDQKGDSAKEIKKPVLGIFAVLWVVIVILRKFIY